MKSTDYFYNNLGVWFDFDRSDTASTPLRGIRGRYHTAREYGLYPASKPVISSPEVQTSYIDIPGMDGALDATQALDDVVHYRNREFEAEYVYIGDRAQWDAVYHRILGDLLGRTCKVIIDENPDGYYAGRVTEIEPEYNKYTQRLTITATLSPFKMEFSNAGDDWLWDPFSFETGVISTVRQKSIGGTQTITLYGSHYTQVPDIYVHEKAGTLTVSYSVNGTLKSVELETGSNLANTPDLLLGRENKEITLTGAAIVSIRYIRGML